MSQLATIFEKIKEDFFTNHVEKGIKDDYNLVFSPFSTGFTNEDFLFLDATMTSRSGASAQKYYQELSEFSQISNTIPRGANFWAVSDDNNDLLYNPYKTIINSLRFLDPDTLSIEMLYEDPLFFKALDAINSESKTTYYSFFELRRKHVNELKELRETLSESNKEVIELQIQMCESNIKALDEEWVEKGFKEEIETKVIDILKDEFQRFITKHTKIKALLENPQFHNSDFYPTFCTPNNLYQSDELEWTKIRIDKQELKTLLGKINKDDYQNIFDDTAASGLELDTIQFELIFVNVTRNWYDESILNSSFWDINILNKDEIDIPNVTSKLIFIRKVDLKLKPNSRKNQQLLNTTKQQNLGPFMINFSNLKLNNTLSLSSINKSLKIDRKVVMNVGSKLQKKQQNQGNNALIAKKQKQFIKLAPRLQTKLQVKAKPKPKVANQKIFLAKPMMLRTAILIQNTTRCTFSFKDSKTNTPISIHPNAIEIQHQGKKVNVKLNPVNATLQCDLNQNAKYKLIINHDDYEPVEFEFQTTKAKHANYSITLHEIVDESFQLIGVVAKRIKPFPNPIKKADYI